ncbi:hypothetical protein UA08_01040 [Talaromyces atroroseus]|uniref:DOC domain-containing protein n=1 Tax=Talaromyces atroroseus TaxID=1441469 RepID=A0A225B9P0_TALAT|nr:hypothetical protein UA08_01040 [Talaromyces atroroseus]OKL64106.1 hypothetical protein UA08_01040 [Talaromyces atroroseus]
MPRQMPRRTPAAPPPPSTPATTAFQQQPPPVPVFATPRGFAQNVDEFTGGDPERRVGQQQQQQHRLNQLARTGFEVAAAAAAMPDIGDETDVENDRSDDEIRVIDFDALGEARDGDAEEDDVDGDLEDDEYVEGDDENEEMRRQQKSPSPLPPDLREISSLASWTVSTHKPGCGVAALRNPSPQQFWQSDGPQPHTLTLHFFKLVAIVKMRVYLDFDLDESYTPTKMLFFAGMGGNDLVEFAVWEGETPCGWVNIPLEGVGGHNRKREHGVRNNRRQTQRAWPSKGAALPNGSGIGDDDNDNDMDDDDDNDDDYNDLDDPYSGNVLKAMVVQVRICENHQNGKDTHVRGFQVFAHDDDRRRVAAAASGQPEHKRQSIHKSHNGVDPVVEGLADKIHGPDEPDWMGEPVIR